MMLRNDFLNATIDDGIMEIVMHYQRPDQKDKREGGIAGFEACRGRSDAGLVDLLVQAKLAANDARQEQNPRYWYYRYYELQVEWVINVISACQYLEGRTMITTPTIRGLTKASRILEIPIGIGV